MRLACQSSTVQYDNDDDDDERPCSSAVAPSSAKMMPDCELSPTAVTTILPLPSITCVPAYTHTHTHAHFQWILRKVMHHNDNVIITKLQLLMYTNIIWPACRPSLTVINLIATVNCYMSAQPVTALTTDFIDSSLTIWQHSTSAFIRRVVSELVCQRDVLSAKRRVIPTAYHRVGR